ncbi:MAG TPA: hypothetical protein VHQ41_02735 [Patescibacteria group bacterium]|jgi:hypothetical protein|nr:hypothetical protein [Patescibacteria group bacterium]
MEQVKIKQLLTVIGAFIVAGLVVAVGTVIYKKYVAPTPVAIKLPVQQKDLPVNQVPEKFPTDVPIETGATITQNYNATADDGRFQATRAFETNKSLAENLTLYTNYLKAGGWTLNPVIDQDMFKLISGSKGNQQIQFAMTENNVSHKKTVTISLTEIK